jgi:hypothetical protein
MVLGIVDPMEGSVAILGGSALIALGMAFDRTQRRVLPYWLWVFGLIAVGVGALWGFSAIGGIGGNSGHSNWWLLLMAPYPIGWVMGIRGIIRKLLELRKLPAHNH